ncbi:TolC family protein [Alistipes timonensis]|uniref:Outer membrane protein n=1 Tax=Alistipes timonensis JC136 TaxID=1033731 RepID=A0A1H4FWL1_9BACT|nr:outer membrane protein [Alistipes timonensis JC136]
MMKTGILLAALFAATAACAQGAAPESPGQSPAAGIPWTLDDCIGFAQRNNLDVQRRSLQVEKSDVELSTAKYSRLPDLNASVGADASFGRVLSSDNTYQTKNQTSGSLNVSASVPLFQGMRINHQVKAGKLDLAAAVEDLERAREDVAIHVMTLYLEVLYNKEMVGVAERQLTLSTQQAERSRALAAAGKQPESTVYESDALVASNRMTLTQARNDLQLALLNLSQALNRESAAGFDIVDPALDSVALAALHRLGSADDVYAYAAENRPHIRAERLRLESSEHSAAIARSALYPSLSLSGGYGTGVYSADQDKFWTQMRHNSREYVGVSLNVPIFNRRATRNSIRTAQIAVRSQQLAVTEAERELRKLIEQAWYNADASYAKYRSAEAAAASARIAFAYEERKAEAGRSTVFDFNDAKTRMEKAEADAVQAKYEFVFRSKILDFYRGKPLQL